MPAKRLYRLVRALNECEKPEDLVDGLFLARDWLAVSAVLIARYTGDAEDSDLVLLGRGVSEAYLERYSERRYDLASETIQALQATQSPVIWNIETIHVPPNSVVAEIEAGAIAEGLGRGVSVPCWQGDRLAGWVAYATSSDVAGNPANLFAFQLLALTAFDRMTDLMRNAAQHGVLTAREYQTLELAADGLSTKEIGRKLDVSDRTVEFHMKNIAAKLGASNKAHSVAKAMSMGLIHQERGS